MQRIADAWQRIEAALLRRAPELSRALAPPATRAHLRRLEKALGLPLPRDLAASLRIHNGMTRSYLGENRFFNYEALLSTDNILDRWKALKSLLDQKIFSEAGCPVTKTRKLKNDAWWRPAWVPITDSDGDGYFVDLDPPVLGTPGQVFYFYNAGARPRRVVAGSYLEWLEMVATKLGRAKLDSDGLLGLTGL